eukprot:10208716-Karenia_brevis.AAC.1
MSACKPIKSITMDKPPEHDDLPSAEQLRDSQAFAGSFNWLATKTRPDVSYWTSLLASSASEQASWSRDLAHK